jgi:hypothetical protein
LTLATWHFSCNTKLGSLNPLLNRSVQMKEFLFVLIVTLTLACGKNGKNGSDGQDGASTLGLNGSDAVSTGVDFSDIGPGLACANGGISIFTFRDHNSDGSLQEDEEVIKVKSICHGTNGTSPSLTLESVASSTACLNGGVKISSSLGQSQEICNGANGLNGEQGIQGVQGVPGIAGVNGADGAPGTSVMPVKFCPSDNSRFPEYGLIVGNELFAVYWGPTPGSPNKAQAFLTKLIAGNYQSTGGNNCLFSIQ